MLKTCALAATGSLEEGNTPLPAPTPTDFYTRWACAKHAIYQIIKRGSSIRSNRTTSSFAPQRARKLLIFLSDTLDIDDDFNIT
jgi:hypothetical protein